MEVIMKNVPRDLGDRNLSAQLQPYMNALGILAWMCTTARGKTIGFVVFLEEQDGKAFLNRHGKKAVTPADALSSSSRRFGRSRDIARLFLMNTPVYVSMSNKTPDPFHLRSLHYRLDERISAGPGREETQPAVTLATSRLACGHLFLPSSPGTLYFVDECRCDFLGIVKFYSKMLVLRSQHAAGTILRIPYDTMEHAIFDSKASSFTLVLREAPRIFAPETAAELMQRLSVSPASNRGKALRRVTHIPDAPAHGRYVPHCLVYRIDIMEVDAHKHSVMTQLKRQELFTLYHAGLPIVRTPRPLYDDFETSYRAFQQDLETCERQKRVPFRLLFQCQAWVWNNYLHPFVAARLLKRIRTAFEKARRSRRPDPVSEESMKALYETIPFPYPGISPSELDADQLMHRILRKESRSAQDEALMPAPLPTAENSGQRVNIFKATVTPTRITLHGPDPEPMNRILRKFPDFSEFFLRVQFCDENGDDLFFSPKVSNDIIFERFRKVLINGVPVAGRVYSFLGFSHSSLRSHSAWFSAPFVDKNGELQTYGVIIRSLGDFKQIRVPARCAARIGQAFSETPSYVSLLNDGINAYTIPDVKSDDGERVFSDGVGFISQDALDVIWARLGGGVAPTGLQIRWAGAKGMLCLNTVVPGRSIHVRDSMIKFPSEDRENLEICDAATKPLRFVLNRQVIKILEDMGVSDDWFLSLQAREINRLRAVTADAYNTGTFLQLQGIGNGFYLSTFIKTLDKYGIDYRMDDFLRTVVESVVLRELRLLKHKARIPVPKGVTLFGVMDETGFLGEGEVYVTFDRDHHRRFGTSLIDDSLAADGWLLVTRSPALHPGDIQLAEMRTPPAGHPLRALRNCIAFSRRGTRDLPSQLSGGDLDGDLYNVIWDRGCWPGRSCSPADYPRVTAQALDREVTREDMANWFVDFMKSDVLGMIATRHLVLSDQRDEGTLDPDCLRLAMLHSTAVDFSKTGQPVDVTSMPRAGKFRPDFLAPAPPAILHDRHHIDFLGKPAARDDTDADADEDGGEDAFRSNYEYYKSEKILGRLYRNVDEKRIWDDDICRVGEKREGPELWTQFTALMRRKLHQYVQGRITWRKKREEAWRLRDMWVYDCFSFFPLPSSLFSLRLSSSCSARLYEEAVHSAMWKYSDNHMKMLQEVEVFCGTIFNKSGSQTRRQKDNSSKLKEEFDRIAAMLVGLIRRRSRDAEQQQQQQQDGSRYEGTDIDHDAGDDDDDDADDLVAAALAPGKDALELAFACLDVGMVKRNEAEYKQLAGMQSFRVIAASCLLKEMTAFVNRLRGGSLRVMGGGGGFVGVSSGGPAIFPQYGDNPCGFDPGHFQNYGFTQYL
ncbi:RNA-dependent RNA polymerase [Sodiomyces alkalinus F11]|uniref:RNA-dependent RNA polymerase n=1 Tax=Sodiomyces alkalinus (strain CBS 110278 / VKM F-3762 / F11) TaxID=1314773 RepID=A0A3N2PKL3_SODAK|nr:RNA-dependent RNA polymerase [Sodiomyces alkalinus F11]ROT35068.1 RNA-dependent RNA polymerase [Sodiomyces alkalinus F11]